MSLINNNDILYVWTIHYDILYTSCTDKMSIYNIDKDIFVYMWYIKMVYISYRQKYPCLYCVLTFCLYITDIFTYQLISQLSTNYLVVE